MAEQLRHDNPANGWKNDGMMNDVVVNDELYMWRENNFVLRFQSAQVRPDSVLFLHCEMTPITSVRESLVS